MARKEKIKKRKMLDATFSGKEDSQRRQQRKKFEDKRQDNMRRQEKIMTQRKDKMARKEKIKKRKMVDTTFRGKEDSQRRQQRKV
jgi:hypothetical protein